MYVTLCRDNEKNTTKPIFYSEGILKSKRDLRLYVLQVLEFPKVYSFRYSLEEFENDTIARYADEANHSVEIIQINTLDNGYIFSNKVRDIKIISVLYFVEVDRFREPETETSGIREEFEMKRICRPVDGGFQGLDKVLEELKRKVKQRARPVETGPVETGPVETGPVETGPVDEESL